MLKAKAAFIACLVLCAVFLTALIVSAVLCHELPHPYCQVLQATLIIVTVIMLVCCITFAFMWRKYANQTAESPTPPPQLPSPEVPSAELLHPAYIFHANLPTGVDDGQIPGFLAYSGFKIATTYSQFKENRVTYLSNLQKPDSNLIGVDVGPFNLRVDVAPNASTDESKPVVFRAWLSDQGFRGYFIQEDPLCILYLPNPLPLVKQLQ